jgi:hypothetical protein
MRLPEGDMGALKRVGVPLYKILLLYKYILCIAGLDNKLYMMHGTYIKIKKKIFLLRLTSPLVKLYIYIHIYIYIYIYI